MRTPKRQAGVAKIHELDSSSDQEYKPQSRSRAKAKAITTIASKKRKREPATLPDNKSINDYIIVASSSATAKALTAKDWRHPVSQHIITNPLPMREALLRWYAQVHEIRGMPWRKPYNDKLSLEERSQRAYEVWVSEIMLQQTQVVTVIGYYNRWMQRFPTIHELAAADIETVNSLWKGLGYYSRAARLLSGAQKIINEYDDVFPQSAKEMQANIPGIGRYSSGAISSIAYNHCEPVLDGNVTRVLCRVFALNANPKSKGVLDILWAGADAMVKNSTQPGDINQALIELGATVCKVRNPSCESCPLRSFCAAYRETENTDESTHIDDDIEELCTLCLPASQNPESGVMCYPLKVEKKKAREELDVVCVIEWRPSQCSSTSSHTANDESDGRWFLLSKRPETGLLAGLHDFPSRACMSTESGPKDPKALKEVAYEVLEEVLVTPPLRPSTLSNTTKARRNISVPTEADVKRVQVKKIQLAGDVLHVFSHIRKTYRVQWVVLEGEGAGGVEEGCRPPEVVKVRRERIEVDLDETEAEDDDDDDEKPKKKTKVVKGKAKAKGKTGKEGTLKKAKKVEDSKEPSLRWVKYEDVEKANIGTGILKVWRLVNELWADGVS